MNVRCINCTYKITCNKASEEIVECDKFKKISYETKLVKVDGLNYKFERIDEIWLEQKEMVKVNVMNVREKENGL